MIGSLQALQACVGLSRGRIGFGERCRSWTLGCMFPDTVSLRDPRMVAPA